MRCSPTPTRWPPPSRRNRPPRSTPSRRASKCKDGYADYLTELAAADRLSAGLLSQVQAQATRFGDTAALYQALGGGWWNRNGAHSATARRRPRLPHSRKVRPFDDGHNEQTRSLVYRETMPRRPPSSRRICRSAAISSISRPDGHRALNAILKTDPDLVLCDINMPGMSGFEVMEQLTALAPASRVRAVHFSHRAHGSGQRAQRTAARRR